MKTLISKILSIVMPLLAGIGIAVLADKNLVGKVPGYDEPVAPAITPKKIALFLAVFAVGNMIFRFVSRKLKLKI
jgi:hypothetical protein